MSSGVKLTSKKLAVLLSKAGNGITLREGEGSARGLGGVLQTHVHFSFLVRSCQNVYPFHAVTGSNLTEHRAVTKSANIGRVGQLRVVRGSAEVQFSLRFSKRVQFDRRGGGAAACCGSWRTRLRGDGARCAGLE